MADDKRLRRRNRPSKHPFGLKPELLSALAAVDFDTADAICRQQARAEVSSVKQSDDDGQEAA